MKHQEFSDEIETTTWFFWHRSLASNSFIILSRLRAISTWFKFWFLPSTLCKKHLHIFNYFKLFLIHRWRLLKSENVILVSTHRVFNRIWLCAEILNLMRVVEKQEMQLLVILQSILFSTRIYYNWIFLVQICKEMVTNFL